MPQIGQLLPHLYRQLLVLVLLNPPVMVILALLLRQVRLLRVSLFK